MITIELAKHRQRRDELLDLFRLSFGHDMSAELWDWKYLRNPLTTAEPEVIVALDSGKIVGARPLLFDRMWLGNKKIKVAQTGDVMVHHHYRRQGIYSQMNEFALNYCKANGYSLLYSFPSRITLQVNLKQGWEIVTEVETLFQTVNSQKLLAHKLKSRLLGNISGYFYDNLFSTKIKNTKQITPLSDSLQVSSFDRFDDNLSAVDTLRDNSRIDLVRDETCLKWRFDQHPEHKYKYITVQRDEHLCGFAVISAQEIPSGLIDGKIVDFLVKDGDVDYFRLLINECLNDLRELECDLISIWVFTQPHLRRELFKHYDFKSSTKFPYNAFFGKCYFAAQEIDDRATEKIDIYDKNNWRVSNAYLDTT